MKTILKQNKALFILPLILLPFVVLIFYILGGGNPTENAGQNNPQNEGANYSIPQAESSIEIADKLEAYEQQGGRASTRDYGILANMDSSNNQGQLIISMEDSVVGENSEGEVVNANISSNLLAHIKQKEEEINRELCQPESRRPDSITHSKKTSGSGTGKSTSKYETPVKTQPTPVILQKTGIEELDQVFEENLDVFQGGSSLQGFKQASDKPGGFLLDPRIILHLDYFNIEPEQNLFLNRFLIYTPDIEKCKGEIRDIDLEGLRRHNHKVMKRRAHSSVILLALVDDYGNDRRQLPIHKHVLVLEFQPL